MEGCIIYVAMEKVMALILCLLDSLQTPPWLAKNSDEGNPLCCSLGKDMTTQENIARYLVSQDEHLLRTLGQARYPVDQCSTLILDKCHRSNVFIGMQRGFSKLVKQILTSDLPYALNGQNGETPLHYASKCDEQVSRLLLEKHHELIREVSSSGKTMLNQAVEDGAMWLVRLMLTHEEGIKCTIPYWPRVRWTKACRRLIWHRNKDGDTPLHIAARKGDIEISKLLIQGFKSALQKEAEDCDSADDMFEPGYDLMGVNPLYLENRENDIPLVLALRHKHDDCGVMLSMETFPLVENYSLVPLYTKCLPVAMDNGCLSSAKMILERVISHASGGLGFRINGAGIKSPGVRKIADHMSLYLLMMSLGGTMMAFMAGTYAIMAPKTMADAIFIIILCSLTLFMACIFWLLTYPSQFKKHLCNLFAWPKKKLWDAIRKAVQALSTSQQPPRRLNAPPTQASNNIDLMDNVQSESSNTPVTHASDDNIEANVQPRISNTPMTQDSGDITGDVQSGISNKPIIQDSSNPPTKTQTPSLNGEGRQFSDTSPLAPDDIKIEIRRS